MNAKDLYTLAEKCFSKRSGFISLLQEIAEQFFVERATFTNTPDIGHNFASHLVSSYPLIVRRDLGNAMEVFLRPKGKVWFHPGVADEDFSGDNEAKRWLEWIEGIMRRAMYDRATQFERATKEGDHDYATFGQTVLQCEKVLDNQRVGPHLLYRCWHLRDVAWMDNKFGMVGSVFRRWKPTGRDLMGLFKNVHKSVVQKSSKDPYCEINSIHMMVESDMYDGDYMGRKMDMPYVSVHYDIDHDHVMEAVGKWSKEYIIPRWQTVSGSQYSYSPATVAALPDARLLQAITKTLLEAGEKAVNPPLVVVREALRSDINVYAGGIISVDAGYDERTGGVLKPLINDKAQIPLGNDMLRDSRAMIGEAFFLSKLNLPPGQERRTAYEVSQLVQENIRNMMPLFSPTESEYNGGLCEETFEQMFGSMIRMEAKGVRTPLQIPRSLSGADIQFHFESPLHDLIEKQKLGQYLEGRQVLADSIALDPSLATLPDGKTALRDVLQAIWPAKWVNSETKVEELEAIMAQQQEAQQLLGTMQAAADVGATGAAAAKDLAAAQI